MVKNLLIMLTGALLALSCSKSSDELMSNYANLQKDFQGDPISFGHPAYGEYDMEWKIDGMGSSQGIFYAYDKDGIANQFHAFIDPASGLPQRLMELSYPVKAVTTETLLGSVTGDPYNCTLRRQYIGYSQDAYYYRISSWLYAFYAYDAEQKYLYEPVIDIDRSTMLYDTLTGQWSGCIVVKQIQVRSIVNAGTDEGSATYGNIGLFSMDTPLQLIFQTTKKIR